jgi:ABC-type transport system involved in cytochrome bd biosynthesis fused ATPase/permease subunit
MTVLMISHQQSSIRGADQVVSLAGGRIAGLSSRGEVKL